METVETAETGTGEIDAIDEFTDQPFHRKLWLFFGQLNLYKLQIIVCVYFLGISFGVISTFLFLRLQELGASTMLMGFTVIFTMCSEVPAFYIIEYALVYLGEYGVISISLLSYILRLGWYGVMGLDGIMENPWYVMPAEALHGLTFAWVKASIAIFAHQLASGGQRNNGNKN